MVAKKEKETDAMSLTDFKRKHNVSDMEYAGMRAVLNIKNIYAEIEDSTVIISEAKMLKALKKFNEMPAFIE